MGDVVYDDNGQPFYEVMINDVIGGFYWKANWERQ